MKTKIIFILIIMSMISCSVLKKHNSPSVVVVNFIEALKIENYDRAVVYLSENLLNKLVFSFEKDLFYDNDTNQISETFAEYNLSIEDFHNMTLKEKFVLLVVMEGDNPFIEFEYEVISENITGDCAFVRIYSEDDIFDDEINLIIEDGEWKIDLHDSY